MQRTHTRSNTTGMLHLPVAQAFSTHLPQRYSLRGPTGSHFFHPPPEPSFRYRSDFCVRACAPRFAHRHARRPILGSCGGRPRYSKLTGAGSLGLVFTNHEAFGHSNATTVYGAPNCTKPLTLSEIHVISFSSGFLSTLDHLHKVPKSAS